MSTTFTCYAARVRMINLGTFAGMGVLPTFAMATREDDSRIAAPLQQRSELGDRSPNSLLTTMLAKVWADAEGITVGA